MVPKNDEVTLQAVFDKVIDTIDDISCDWDEENRHVSILLRDLSTNLIVIIRVSLRDVGYYANTQIPRCSPFMRSM